MPCKVEVVQLSDMKKEYALTMAKLRLVKEIPAQIADGNGLRAGNADVVLLFFEKQNLIGLLISRINPI